MVSTTIRSKKLFFLIPGMIALLLVLACGSDAATATPAAEDQDGPEVSQTDISNVLTALAASSESGLFAQAASGFGSGSGSGAGISVSGRGEATAVPDLAILSLGVEALADSVSEARNQAAVAMEGVLAVLSESGVPERDIRTTFFNINPRYTNREVRKCVEQGAGPSSGRISVTPTPAIASPDAATRSEPEIITPLIQEPITNCFTEFERVLLGFQVTNQVSAKIRDLDSVGDVIDRVTEAGGDLTRFQSVSFTIEDTEALEVEARAAAVGDLLAKAQQIADLTGVKLGQLQVISESGGFFPQAAVRLESVGFDAAPAAATQIMGGELNVSVNLQAVFAIESSSE